LTQFEKSSKRTKVFAFDVDFIAMEEFFKTKSKALKDMTCAKHERNRLRDEENKLRNKSLTCKPSTRIVILISMLDFVLFV